jgi:hypothetical protein
MAFFDLPKEELRKYKPARSEEKDFDSFWSSTLADTKSTPLNPRFTPYETGLDAIEAFDVSYNGFGAERIAAWLILPAAALRPSLPGYKNGRLPCIVEFIGYGGGRAFPWDWLFWASAGFAHFVMDSRGQGASWSPGDTPDSGTTGPSVPGVMTMGIIGTEYDTANMRYIAGVVAACEEYGLITAAEMLPNGFSSNPEDRNLKAMNIACRAGAELGFDIVKTPFVKPLEDFKKVVANCYADVLALGGEKVNDDRQVLENAKQAIEAGCKGLVIGRNVWGHRNVTGMAAALSRIVHENASVEDALKEIQ